MTVIVVVMVVVVVVVNDGVVETAWFVPRSNYCLGWQGNDRSLSTLAGNSHACMLISTTLCMCARMNQTGWIIFCFVLFAWFVFLFFFVVEGQYNRVYSIRTMAVLLLIRYLSLSCFFVLLERALNCVILFRFVFGYDRSPS